MLERSEASKISYLVISTTIRRKRIVEGFARKNPKTSKGEILPIVRMTNSASHVILNEAKNLKQNVLKPSIYKYRNFHA